MATEITNEQRNELIRHGNKPVPVVDPQTNSVYFLVAGEMFERLRAIFDDESFDISETYAAQSAVAGAAGWDDREMDVYDDYDSHKKSS